MNQTLTVIWIYSLLNFFLTSITPKIQDYVWLYFTYIFYCVMDGEKGFHPILDRYFAEADAHRKTPVPNLFRTKLQDIIKIGK